MHARAHTHTHTTVDDCEEVEQQTQIVIHTIENVIGESIQQHF